jgi:epoxyqueuosine reductase
VIERCRALGFAEAGVCQATPTAFADELRAWLASGEHGSMDYLARHAALRVDPRLVLPGARSIVMVADLYESRGTRGEGPKASSVKLGVDAAGGVLGRIARYARGRDYHEVIKRRLHALADELRAEFAGDGAEFRVFVDTAPVLEREHAARCGLGWIGKHTLAIHPRLGSYTLLGGVLTTLDLSPPTERHAVTDHCGTCTRCIDACPTRAITPYHVDARRCISYLTIERRGMIDPEFHRAIGDRIFGCDVCQEVCPHNSPREASDALGERIEANPEYSPRRDGFDLLAVLDWREEDRRREFSGTSLKRATLVMMKRNAAIALGNAAAAGKIRPNAACERLRTITHDEQEPEIVRSTARRVLDDLEKE